MGGFGSGRHGGGPLVEGGLVLDADRLRRQKVIGPGLREGVLRWTETATGKSVATVRYLANFGETEGSLWLTYSSTRLRSGEKRVLNYEIKLVAKPLPYGGSRWFFLCPRLGNRCLKLHLPEGGWTFASRRAHGLAYPSQRETERDRALRTAFRACRRVGDTTGGIGDYVPKPKWMRQRTYTRLMEVVERTEAVVEAYTVDLVAQLDKRAHAVSRSGGLRQRKRR